MARRHDLKIYVVRGPRAALVGRGKRGDISVDTPSDLERSRLLLVWLQARRAVDHCLSDLLAAGPAGERRVREQLELVDELENRAQEAFARYRTVATHAQRPDLPCEADIPDWAVPADRPRLGVVRTGERHPNPGSNPRPEPQRPLAAPGTQPPTGSVPGMSGNTVPDIVTGSAAHPSPPSSQAAAFPPPGVTPLAGRETRTDLTHGGRATRGVQRRHR